MRRKNNIILSLVILMLSFVNIILSIGANATLKFQTTQPVQFTFNPTLSLSISGDLVVSNLTAGDNDDSNEITVAVNTNVLNGYYLTATAGTSSTNTNLVNTVNSNYLFTSLATDADLEDMNNADDNTWGYAFKVGSDSYSNYSGLPLDNDDSGETGAVLVNTTTAADSKVVTFKIGAKASASQPSGEYTNTVNFYAVSYQAPEPPVIEDLQYMQDFATLSEGDKANVIAKMTTGTQYQLQDSRDNKTYYIAKLLDGNIWMTENLDFDIDSTKTYTPADTDISADWTPRSSTDTTFSLETFYPESYDPGELCWNGVIGDSGSTIPCTQNDASHYHLGNYYNWTAALASNDSSGYQYEKTPESTADLISIDQSVCPAGWSLQDYSHSEQEGSDIHWSRKTFDNLVIGYNAKAGADGDIQESPLFLTYSGIAYEGQTLIEGLGYFGGYWSSTIGTENNSGLPFSFTSGGDMRPYSYPREYGLPIRCMVR